MSAESSLSSPLQPYNDKRPLTGPLTSFAPIDTLVLQPLEHVLEGFSLGLALIIPLDLPLLRSRRSPSGLARARNSSRRVFFAVEVNDVVDRSAREVSTRVSKANAGEKGT
jgi:hypothetical protein